MSDEGEGLQTGAHAGLGPGAAQETDPGAASSATTSTLETLPFEIQRLILTQSPTLDTLIAAVNASPRLHSVYVQDRASILRDFVHQSLDGILFDAHGAYLSGSDEFQQTRTVPILWGFLEAYQQRRTTTAESDLVAQLSLDDVIGLARFHRSVVEPLTERYAIWALAALSSSPQAYPLCDTERRRIQRGLYRFEIFCNVCGSKGEGRSAPHHIESRAEEIRDRDRYQRTRILSLFPAWQVEEILCVYKFAKDTYGGVFDRVAWDLDEERNPRYRHVDMTEVNEDLQLFSREGYIHKESLETMTRHGLGLLARVFEVTDHEEMVALVRHSIVSIPREHGGGWLSEWIRDIVTREAQDLRRKQLYNEHDVAQDRRDKTPFEGDTSDAPSLAWVTLWKGEASNLFGDYVLSYLRRWGYAMWDAPRLQASGATYFLVMDPTAAFQTYPCDDRREDMLDPEYADYLEIWGY